MRLATVAAVAIVLGACAGTSSVTALSPTNTPIPQPTATATPAAQATVIGVTGTVVAVTSQYGSATAACPAGEPLLSGGFIAHYDANPNGAGPAPTENYPLSATTWKVTVRTLGNPTHLTAIAVCLQANFPVTIQVAQSAGSGNTASVACPTGTALTGGGFQSATAPDVYSQPNGNGWQVDQEFINQGNANPTAYALCASQGLTAASVQQASASVGVQQDATSGAKCPQGQLPVGGGYNGYHNSVDVEWDVYHAGPNFVGQSSNVSSGWTADAHNGEMSTESFVVYVICATH
jgi:hypothetical protein